MDLTLHTHIIFSLLILFLERSNLQQHLWYKSYFLAYDNNEKQEKDGEKQRGQNQD